MESSEGYGNGTIGRLCTVDRRNPANQLISSWFSHYLQGFVHPRWLALGFLNYQQYDRIVCVIICIIFVVIILFQGFKNMTYIHISPQTTIFSDENYMC